MENASKALIIAGAILLSILIISLGVVVFQQAQNIANSNGMSDVEKTAFNSKFTQYEGDSVKGTGVNALLQAIRTSNADSDNEEKQVYVNNAASCTTTAATGSTYKVECEYSTKGIVWNVKINGGTGTHVFTAASRTK